MRVYTSCLWENNKSDSAIFSMSRDTANSSYAACNSLRSTFGEGSAIRQKNLDCVNRFIWISFLEIIDSIGITMPTVFSNSNSNHFKNSASQAIIKYLITILSGELTNPNRNAKLSLLLTFYAV